MERFSLGRAIVRDLLRILEARGQVVRQSHRGAVVADFSAKEVRDIYCVRMFLEEAAGKLAFNHITGQQIDRMARLQDKLKSTTAVDKATVKLHEEFHGVIFKATHNAFLEAEIKRLIVLTGPIRYLPYAHPGRRETVLADHDRMVDALQQKDRDHFVDLCRSHLFRSMREYLTIFYPAEADNLLAEFEDMATQMAMGTPFKAPGL